MNDKITDVVRTERDFRGVVRDCRRRQKTTISTVLSSPGVQMKDCESGRIVENSTVVISMATAVAKCSWNGKQKKAFGKYG